MKVAHVLLSDRAWGIVRVVDALAAMQSKQAEVWIAGNEDIREYFQTQKGVQFVPLDIRFNGKWPSTEKMLSMLGSFQAAAERLKVLEREERIDVFHFHLPNALALALLFRPRQSVYTIHGDFFENKALKKSKDILMPLILGRRRRVTAISSEPVKPKWLLGRVSIIPNGIDPGPVVARSSKEDPTLGPILELKRKGFNPVILFPGQVIRRKGHEFALLAMREILATHPKAALVVVGEGPDRPYLEDLARKTGVQDSVFFLGYAANQYPAMANADVLLSHLTSQWPLPSLVELEGIALKKQVITLGTPEKRSLYDDSVIFLEREDNSELERAVNSALTKGEAARRIKNGEAVLRKLSWDSIASTYLQLYANVIGLKQPRST